MVLTNHGGVGTGKPRAEGMEKVKNQGLWYDDTAGGAGTVRITVI